MSEYRLHHPSAGLIVSVIALVVALGGTGYAAFTLPKNSVGTKQLKNNAVTTSKIKNGAVTGSKVNLGTLGTVRNATHASSADSATTATNATHASSADSATTATNATNAAAVDGRQVATFSKLVAPSTSTPQTVVSIGGLTLTLACDSFGNPTFSAVGSVNGSVFDAGLIPANGSPRQGIIPSTAGAPVELVHESDGAGALTLQYIQPDGHVVSVNAYTAYRTSFADCSASGSAISGG